MGTSYNANIATDGLVLCLDAANPRSYPLSGTSWNDLSGNGNNGDLAAGNMGSGNWTNGVFDFDGSNEQIITNNVELNLNNGMTIIQFLKPTSILSGSYIGSFSYRNGLHNINLLHFDTGVIRLETYGSNQLYSPSGLFNIGDWYFCAGSFSGTTTDGGSGTSKIYFNGELVISGTRNGTPGTTAPFIIGTYGRYFNGFISNTLFYNRELSAQEIRQNYNSIRGRYGI